LQATGHKRRLAFRDPMLHDWCEDSHKEGRAVKVTVNFDCTPEEARNFLGLPDVSPIHDKYVQTMLDTMDGSNSVEQMENLFRSFSPMGDAGVRLFKQVMDMGMMGSSKKNDG
jgi:hypothetical protein